MATGTGFTLRPDDPHTFPEWIRHRARIGGDKLALEVCGVTRTYAELDDRTDRAAAGLAALGLEHRDHVSVMMQNSIENIETWFGLQKAGIVEVPVHTASRGAALQYIVDHADAKALVIDELFLPHLVQIVDELPKLRQVVVNRAEPGRGGGRAAVAARRPRPRGRPRRRRARAGAERRPARHRRRPPLVGDHRAAEGRRPLARGGDPPDAPPRLADGVRRRRPALHGVPALPQQRQVHERVRRARGGRHAASWTSGSR